MEGKEERGQAQPDAHDRRRRRCPMLGHPVDFHYCRTQEGDRLCARIVDCWWETFDVLAFLGATAGEERLAALLGPPPSRFGRLVETIERVKKERGEES